ncbi:MAG: hypothetical protein Q9159_004254 [Coniocarpon cinnabarinum]
MSAHNPATNNPSHFESIDFVLSTSRTIKVLFKGPLPPFEVDLVQRVKTETHLRILFQFLAYSQYRLPAISLIQTQGRSGPGPEREMDHYTISAYDNNGKRLQGFHIYPDDSSPAQIGEVWPITPSWDGRDTGNSIRNRSAAPSRWAISTDGKLITGHDEMVAQFDNWQTVSKLEFVKDRNMAGSRERIDA